jgi:endonuclease III
VRKRDKGARIAAVLEELFPLPATPLLHDSPFALLVAVVLSAQTTDAQVNRVTPALFARASTPREMAALKESEILRLIRSCGLAPTKARNLKRLAAVIEIEHGGEVPGDIEQLEALPGVGHKTASVVAAQAFGIAAFPVDTHIHRLAYRWGLSNGTTVARTERDLKRIFPPDSWHDLHLQMIYFGRKYCPARRHDPDRCPICSWAAPRRRQARRGRQQ